VQHGPIEADDATGPEIVSATADLMERWLACPCDLAAR
jgi:hypothetical protein